MNDKQQAEYRLLPFDNVTKLPPMHMRLIGICEDWVLAERVGFYEPKPIPLKVWQTLEVVDANWSVPSKRVLELVSATYKVTNVRISYADATTIMEYMDKIK